MIDYTLLPLAIFKLLCAIIGVIGNTIMLIVVIRTKRFRSPCHILIAITCVGDAIHVSGQFVFSAHVFMNLTSSQAQCYYMLMIPVIGYTSSVPLILVMGIDRLIAVKFPINYRYFQEVPKRYITIQLIYPICYSLTILWYGYYKRDPDVGNQITCSNPLALRDTAFEVFTYSSGIMYIFVFTIYFTVYKLLKHKKASARFKSFFRSLTLTVTIVACGWVITTTSNIFAYIFITNENTAILIKMYSGITVNAAAASNIFVFYAINAEYREAIKLVFAIQPMTQTTKITIS